MRNYSESIFVAAKKLRKKQTHAEKLLWDEIRAKKIAGYKFRRQVPFDRFILDFLCPEQKLIIEIDGGYHQHFKEKDKERDLYFLAKGYKILRFSNEMIIERMNEVILEIKKQLGVV